MKKNGVRRRYSRTTPVGRVLRNIDKVVFNEGQASSRLRSWNYAHDPRVEEAASLLEQARELVSKSRKIVARLFESDWTPPRRSEAITFAEGDKVMVNGKYRKKYEAVYERDVVDRLTVVKILESGEVAVRGRGQNFIVAKSHIERRV